MSKSPNRDKGHRWELAVRTSLLPIFPDCQTSRNESRTMDNKCIDLCNTGGYAIQCKNYKHKINPYKEFEKMDTNLIKVIAYKDNKVHGKKGEIAIIEREEETNLTNIQLKTIPSFAEILKNSTIKKLLFLYKKNPKPLIIQYWSDFIEELKSELIT